MSNIEWTEQTWNPLVGCTMVSPGCAHCYAETMSKRLKAMAQKDIANGRDPGRKGAYIKVIGDNGKWNGHIELIEAALAEPLKRKKPTMYFVNSMSDLFHEGVPFEFIDKVFAVMALCPQHTFQVLTKRPERMEEYFARRVEEDDGWPVGSGAWDGIGRVLRGWQEGNCDWLNEMNVWSEVDGLMLARHITDPIALPLPNVWLGTSVENQATADERIPHLLACPAAVRFLSVEPLLEEIGIFGPCKYHPPIEDGNPPVDCGSCNGFGRSPLMELGDRIHWVIVGGESGHQARSTNIEWVRSIVRQCKAAGVPVFVKQLGARIEVANDRAGEWPRQGDEWVDLDPDHTVRYQGEPIDIKLEDSKGGNPAEWPEDLRVRQMAKGK